MVMLYSTDITAKRCAGVEYGENQEVDQIDKDYEGLNSSWQQGKTGNIVNSNPIRNCQEYDMKRRRLGSQVSVNVQ